MNSHLIDQVVSPLVLVRVLLQQLEATDDILEREAFVADETDIMNHPLVRSTEAFLLKHLPSNGHGLPPAVVGAGAVSSLEQVQAESHSSGSYNHSGSHSGRHKGAKAPRACSSFTPGPSTSGGVSPGGGRAPVTLIISLSGGQ
jgi:hypothetical protein